MAGLQNQLPQKSTAKLESEHDNVMNERRRQPSNRQKRKMNTLADSDYFYSEKSILCTNYHAHIMLFMCTLHV